ncbi:hypothetical protein GCM10023230_04570 [Flavobacterium hankyongi]|uniref:Carboxypeptidase regulatory-like domain-containing protein n=2 Tax=Flavobacteriaceae TaxID=49546 RepID=A0ABP8ZL82_9FLAO
MGYVYSKTTNLPIEKATIKVRNGDDYFTTISNEKGQFRFLNFQKDDKYIEIEISHISYEKKKWQGFNDSKFYLIEKTNELSEINISSEKEKIIYELPISDRILTCVRNFSWEHKIATFIPYETKNGDRVIKKIIYAISDFEGVKGLKYQPFISNLYSVDTITKLPDKALIENGIKVVKNNEKKWVEVDVSEYNLKMPSEGIFVVMELLSEDKYPFGYIQSNIGVISAVPAIKAYKYNKKYIRKSYQNFPVYTIPVDLSNKWVEQDCHYLMDVEF